MPTAVRTSHARESAGPHAGTSCSGAVWGSRRLRWRRRRPTADEGHAGAARPRARLRYAREWVQAVYDLTWRDDVAHPARHDATRTPRGATRTSCSRCTRRSPRATRGCAASAASWPGWARRRCRGDGSTGRWPWPRAPMPCAPSCTPGWRRSGSLAITALRDAQRRRAPGRRRARGDDPSLAGARARRRRASSVSGSRATASPRPSGSRTPLPSGRGSGSPRRPTSVRPSSRTGTGCAPSS